MSEAGNYLLTGGAAELERLRLLARVWEPEAEAFLDRIGIQPGWTCVDLGCGAMGGGDLHVGQRTLNMLRHAGLQDIQIRSAVIALPAPHPFRRLPLQFATSLRKRIPDANILSESELDAAMAECERIAGDTETLVMSFIVTQVWGRKPSR